MIMMFLILSYKIILNFTKDSVWYLIKTFILFILLSFRGNENVTLTLRWNVIPNAGTLPNVRGVGSEVIRFPDQYTAGRF